MKQNSDFLIEHGALVSYEGSEELVLVPEGVTCIQRDAFAHANQFRELRLPRSIETLEVRSVWNCPNLERINLPQNLKSIEFQALGFCPGLVEVLPGNPLLWCSRQAFGWNHRVRFRRPYGLPNPEIEAYSLECFCRDVENGVQLDEAEQKAFDAYIRARRKRLCRVGLKNPCLLRYLIQENLISSTDIDDLVEESKNLNAGLRAELIAYQGRVHPPQDRIKEEEKMIDAKLSGVYPRSVAQKEWTFCPDGAGGIRILGYHGWETRVVVPSFIGGKPVTEIGQSAFSPWARYLRSELMPRRANITEICLPESVHTIGPDAMHGCAMLRTCSIPKQLQRLGDRAFAFCDQVMSVRLPEQMEPLGKGVFRGCKHLREAVLPENLTEIPEQLFRNCGSLVQIRIPPQVRAIREKAFEGCEQLIRVDLPMGVTCLEGRAFANCERLSTIRVPGSVRQISRTCFDGCRKLSPNFIQELLRRHPVREK